MRNSLKAVVKEILTKYLEENRYRKTPERFAVLDAIYSFDGHFTMEELNEHLLAENFPVSRATLYNTINLLIKLRLVVCHHLQQKKVYEACYAENNRSFQICMVCGKSTTLRLPDITKAVNETHLNRFHKDGFTLYIYGICSHCQARMTRQKNIIKKSIKNRNKDKIKNTI